MAGGFWSAAWAKRSINPPDLEAETEAAKKSRRSKLAEDEKTDPQISRRPWNVYQMGYPRFAAFIVEDSDKSSTIYRRFERLAARNLLYLESELAELEKKQDDMDDEYQLEPLQDRKSSRSWKALRDEASDWPGWRL